MFINLTEFVFGEYALDDVKIEEDDLTISVEKNENFYIYRRIAKGDSLVKDIAGSGKLIINPVEPVNLPKSLTHLLEIELENSLVIEPRSKFTVYLKIPIDIGVFLNRKSLRILDVFTLNDYLKYTLYGTPRRGVICRHYVSDVYSKIPNTDAFKEGILELEINNSSDDWIEMKRVVLDVYGMKLYYEGPKVITKGIVNISRGIVETQFVDGMYGMSKAIEVYVAKGLQILKKTFVMEWGL